jgi:hypothetical protein
MQYNFICCWAPIAIPAFKINLLLASKVERINLNQNDKGFAILAFVGVNIKSLLTSH